MDSQRRDTATHYDKLTIAYRARVALCAILSCAGLSHGRMLMIDTVNHAHRDVQHRADQRQREHR